MRGVLIVVYLLAVLVVLFAAAAVATRDDVVLADAPPDAADLGLPEGPMQPEDVAEVRFGLTLRGYRMAEVDQVLARLAAEVAARDRQITLLEHALVEPAPTGPVVLDKSPVVLDTAPPPVADGPLVDPGRDQEEPLVSSAALTDQGARSPIGERVGTAEDTSVGSVASPTAGTTDGEEQGSTDLTAPDEWQVHTPLADVADVTDVAAVAEGSGGDDEDDFPEVLPPDRAPEGFAEAQETAETAETAEGSDTSDTSDSEPPLGRPGEGASDLPDAPPSSGEPPAGG